MGRVSILRNDLAVQSKKTIIFLPRILSKSASIFIVVYLFTLFGIFYDVINFGPFPNKNKFDNETEIHIQILTLIWHISWLVGSWSSG